MSTNEITFPDLRATITYSDVRDVVKHNIDTHLRKVQKGQKIRLSITKVVDTSIIEDLIVEYRSEGWSIDRIRDESNHFLIFG